MNTLKFFITVSLINIASSFALNESSENLCNTNVNTQVIDYHKSINTQKNEKVNQFSFEIILSISSTEMKFETELEISTLKVQVLTAFGNSVLEEITLTNGEIFNLDRSLPEGYNLLKIYYGQNWIGKFITISDTMKHVLIRRESIDLRK